MNFSTQMFEYENVDKKYKIISSQNNSDIKEWTFKFKIIYLDEDEIDDEFRN